MLTNRENIYKNFKIENFEKRKNGLDMVERDLPTKFGLDPCRSGFRET